MNDNETRVFENHAQDARVHEVGEREGGVCPCIGLTAGNCPSASGNNPVLLVPLEDAPCVTVR